MLPYWKESASPTAGETGETALPLTLSCSLPLSLLAAVPVEAVGVVATLFLAPMDPFLKRTSWRGVEILVYSSAIFQSPDMEGENNKKTWPKWNTSVENRAGRESQLEHKHIKCKSILFLFPLFLQHGRLNKKIETTSQRDAPREKKNGRMAFSFPRKATFNWNIPFFLFHGCNRMFRSKI